MKKKIISLILVSVLLLSSTLPARAEGLSKTQAPSEVEMEVEVQRRVDEVIASIQDQLENLDASYERVYRKYLTEQFEQEVMRENGITPMVTRYYLYDGGVVTYVTYDELTGDRFEIAVTLLDRQRTLDFILAGADFNIGDIVRTVLGFVPKVGGVFSIVFAIDSFCSEYTLEQIRDAGGYTLIENIICTSYPVIEGAGVSSVRGWNEHPYFTRPSNATSVSVNGFPPYEG